MKRDSSISVKVSHVARCLHVIVYMRTVIKQKTRIALKCRACTDMGKPFRGVYNTSVFDEVRSRFAHRRYQPTPLTNRPAWWKCSTPSEWCSAGPAEFQINEEMLFWRLGGYGQKVTHARRSLILNVFLRKSRLHMECLRLRWTTCSPATLPTSALCTACPMRIRSSSCLSASSMTETSGKGLDLGARMAIMTAIVKLNDSVTEDLLLSPYRVVA